MPGKTTARSGRARRQSNGKRPATGSRSPARERLRRLVDELPEAEMGAAERFLDFLRLHGDPSPAGVQEVDEPLTPEEIARAEQGWRECQEGKSRPIEDVYRELVLERKR